MPKLRTTIANNLLNTSLTLATDTVSYILNLYPSKFNPSKRIILTDNLTAYLSLQESIEIKRLICLKVFY